ncbi:hypothetical protein BC938DRAFT_479804 [Jimgerdemannia flammicorona]|uniref:Uncharacterized protein n=1 Tax=Jimgerdemannia flammicorona TaxID=994334 RepID=A0A433QK59_9FUNG|nr:hypothetical protein BC938DRAFT_479804 [Jimgerdemannia flammicorona]
MATPVPQNPSQPDEPPDRSGGTRFRNGPPSQPGGGPQGPQRDGAGSGPGVPFSRMVFDGKRMRKAIQRRTVDYNHSVGKWIQNTISFAAMMSDTR